MDDALEYFTKINGARILNLPKARLADSKLASALAGQDDTGMLSTIARMSQSTDVLLKATASFALPATVAAVFWTVNALVASDSAINTAIAQWRGVAAAARTIFSTWIPAIESALFNEWHGQASKAAKNSFKNFIADGQAFAARAEQMANSLTSVVTRLNDIYDAAFAFAMLQFAALLAATMVVWLNPTAVLVVQRLASLLSAGLTIIVNAILIALGGLLAWTAA